MFPIITFVSERLLHTGTPGIRVVYVTFANSGTRMHITCIFGCNAKKKTTKNNGKLTLMLYNTKLESTIVICYDDTTGK